MAIARLIAPFASLSGTVSAPGEQASSSAVVAMPDAFGRTLLRSYVTPNQPNSIYQLQARSSLTNIVEAYQSLTQSQVDAWSALAKQITESGRLGLDYTLSWTSLFQRVNSYRIQAGLAITPNPPAFTAGPAFGTLDSVQSDNGDPVQQITVFGSNGSAVSNCYIGVRVTRDLGSAVRQARPNELRGVNNVNAGFSLLTNAIPSAGIAVASTRLNVLAGSRIGVEVIMLNSGGVPYERQFIRNIAVSGPF